VIVGVSKGGCFNRVIDFIDYYYDGSLSREYLDQRSINVQLQQKPSISGRIDTTEAKMK